MIDNRIKRTKEDRYPNNQVTAYVKDKTLYINYLFTFGKDASLKLDSWLKELLTFNDIENIEIRGSIFGKIEARVKNHPEIDKIQINIIKDRA
jgi:hypothetical protein